jgi:hypothetical protein
MKWESRKGGGATKQLGGSAAVTGRDVVDDMLHACVDLHASIETLIVGSCTKTKERKRKGVEEGRHGTEAEEDNDAAVSVVLLRFPERIKLLEVCSHCHNTFQSLTGAER